MKILMSTKKAFRQMLHDRVTLVTAKSQHKKLETQVNRRKRDGLKKIEANMDIETTPKPFATHVARIIDGRTHETMLEASINVPYEDEDGHYAAPEDLLMPRFLCDDPEKSSLHAALQFQCGALEIESRVKAKRAATKLEKANKTHACYLLSTSRNVSPGVLDVLDPDGAKIFQVAGDISQVHYTQRTWSLSIESDKCPLVGIAHTMTVLDVYALVTVVPIEALILSGRTMESMLEYLTDDCDARDLEGFPTFGVPPKSSIWIPFAHVPLVVGVSADENDAYLNYVNTYVLDREHASKFDPTQVAEVQAYVTRSLARDSPIWDRQNRDNLRQYLDGLVSKTGGEVTPT